MYYVQIYYFYGYVGGSVSQGFQTLVPMAYPKYAEPMVRIPLKNLSSAFPF